MSQDGGKSSGSNAGVVILIAILLLTIGCCGGLALFAGFFYTAVEVSPPPAVRHESAMPVEAIPAETIAPEPALPEPALPESTDNSPAPPSAP
jgi:hypothetical protein